MKQKIKEILNVGLPIYIIINMLYILVGSCLFIHNIIKYKTFSYMYIVLFVINIIILLSFFRRKKYKKSKIDLFLLLIIIFAIISTIFAYDSMKALFGENGRFEGLFVICYYISILFLTSFLEKEDRRLIVYFIIGIGYIELFYGICQKFGLFNAINIYHKGSILVTGFTNNPNFFGSLMVINIGYSVGLFIDAKAKLKKIIFFCLTILFFIGILISNSLSAVVGLAVIMIMLLIYSLKNKYIKKYIILSITFIFIMLLAVYLKITTLGSDIIQTTNETANILKGDLNDHYGTDRVELWKKTFKIVPKYLPHGIGIDNFANVYNGHPIVVRYYFISNKAHNEYLQILVTMGIFSLISYLCLHFIIIKAGIKKTYKDKEIYYLLPVIGYIIQAQFNISVIEVAPFFYIGLGLLVDRN